MKRIACIAPSYLPSRRANTFQVMKMAGALVELGHTVQMIVPLPGGRHPENLGTGLAWPDLGEHYGLRVEFGIEWVPVSVPLRGYDFGLRAASRTRAFESDLVFTRHPQAAAAAVLRRLPTILEVHDVPHGKMGPLLMRLFLRSRGARRLVVISDALLADLAREFRLPQAPFAVVERDGVDLDRFADLPGPEAARTALGLPERFTAGYTGHLYAGRGVETILDLAGRLPAVQFLLVGGRDADLARVRSAAAGLENVSLPGFVPNVDLPTYQAACDVLLMPYGEKVAASSGGDIAAYLSPMKLFEYLAAGRPILSSDLPVLREVLDEDTAVLLPPGDVDAWAAALADLRADPAHRARLGAAAKTAAAGYDWRARAERILAGSG
jgi:glycosyltransferase involved in cell wall biosynthesis